VTAVFATADPKDYASQVEIASKQLRLTNGTPTLAGLGSIRRFEDRDLLNLFLAQSVA
jgi:hypothetical protein